MNGWIMWLLITLFILYVVMRRNSLIGHMMLLLESMIFIYWSTSYAFVIRMLGFMAFAMVFIIWLYDLLKPVKK